MNILHVKSIELTNILCVRCSFWRSLPFQACFAITVIDILVIRRRQGWTLQFPPLSTRSWFAPLKSSPSVFFSAIVYDLRSLDPGTCLNTKLHAHFAENERFLPAVLSSLISGHDLDDQTGQGRRRLGYEVNFLSTTSGTVD